MEKVNTKCCRCNGYFTIDNITGIHLCPLCECKNELYKIPDHYTSDDIITANKLHKDVKKLFRKHGLEIDNIEIMDLVITSLIK